MKRVASQTSSLSLTALRPQLISSSPLERSWPQWTVSRRSSNPSQAALEAFRMTSWSRRRSVVVLIAIFKLLKGALLMTVAVGLSRFADAGPSGAPAKWAHAVHIDPDGRHLGRAIQAIATRDG